MKLQDYRRQYTLGGLSRDKLPADPVDLFQQWQAEANDAGLADPTGVVLATQQPDGQLRQRFVLLKGCDDRGFIFFTNYNSDKAAAMDSNQQVSLLFPWNELDRQVSISGTAEKLPTAESDAYFANREPEKNALAIASHQSAEIESYEEVVKNYQAALESGDTSKRPEYWGGFQFTPYYIEFWSGDRYRLNKRQVFTKKQGAWKSKFLQP